MKKRRESKIEYEERTENKGRMCRDYVDVMRKENGGNMRKVEKEEVDNREVEEDGLT